MLNFCLKVQVLAKGARGVLCGICLGAFIQHPAWVLLPVSGLAEKSQISAGRMPGPGSQTLLSHYHLGGKAPGTQQSSQAFIFKPGEDLRPSWLMTHGDCYHC